MLIDVLLPIALPDLYLVTKLNVKSEKVKN